MARDPKVLRKAYEAKLGKKLADQLTNEQIGLISKYYNSLSDSESSALDSKIIQGRNNTELHEMAESFIAEKKDSGGGTLSVYKSADKFVDDKKQFAKEQEEKLEDALEETSDKIMDAVDALIAQQNQAFEDFKKQQQKELEEKKKAREEQKEEPVKKVEPKQEPDKDAAKDFSSNLFDGVIPKGYFSETNKGSDQYKKPIGPSAMQGPKEPPKKTVSPENDEDWEGEVEDQLGSKLDDVLEQVRNEPLPQPTKTKRKKTKGKKSVSKKKTGSRKVGLGGSLEEIQENVSETKNALFEMYKVDKKRFEFRKKIDSQLTTMLKAKKAEARLEKDDDDDDDKKGFFVTIGEELKNGLKAGLTAGLIMMLLPAITSLLRPFFNRDPETEGENQWWDPLDLIPNPQDIKDEGTDGTTGDEKSEETTSPPASDPITTADTTDVKSTPPATSPPPATTPSPPPVKSAPVPVRSTNIPGDSGYQKPTGGGGIPFRTAATGGRFDKGKQAPLKPITKTQVNLTEIKNKTKPLMAATMLPQKVGTLGLLSIAKNIISPFAALIPDDGKSFIQNVFRETASMAGIDGYNVDFGTEESIWDAIKKMIFGGDDDTPPPPGGGPGGGPADFSGNDNAEKIFNFYKSQGFTPEQAAGFVGNYDQESTLNPKSVNSIGATGIAQWLGTRKTALFKYAKDNDLDPMDIETQLKFSMTELQGSESGAMREIKKAKTAEEAALAIRRYYERPGEHEAHDERRISSAKKALKDFNKPQVESPTKH